ncbi:MAG: type II toxin-antitoxin system RelE/ParE family toxin [Bdellovibrio sp.]|nr:type II toxin-antitoxin system RelE/ParE family toxin [Bdellovibrio sp.]
MYSKCIVKITIDILYLIGYITKVAALEPVVKNFVVYQTLSGRKPYGDWLNALRDSKARIIILQRLNRLRIGYFGNTKAVGFGLFELKINYGPGFRVYFGKEKNSIIILFLGGDKSTQQKDIKKAQEYLIDYLSR